MLPLVYVSGEHTLPVLIHGHWSTVACFLGIPHLPISVSKCLWSKVYIVDEEERQIDIFTSKHSNTFHSLLSFNSASTMDLSRYFSTRRKVEAQHHHRHSSHSAHAHSHKKPLRLLANPINKDVRQFITSDSGDLEKYSNGNSSDTTTLAGDGKTSRGNVIIYKQHHEASTIELFYDLFFVANLAYFTAEHQHTDGQGTIDATIPFKHIIDFFSALVDYLKLFTIMWFTWLITTLFDVRFSIDCVWNRLHKAIQFGVFTGFVFAGPIFDRYNNVLDRSAFKHFGIVLTVSRVAITIQYAVVMWQGRMFRQTLVPLGLSTCVHAVAALLYGITTAVLPRGQVGLEEQVVWYVL